MISVKQISTKDVLDKIFLTKDFNFLKEHILDEEEVEILGRKKYEIVYHNGKDFKDNIYSNIEDDSQYKWLGIFDNDKLVGLQLISCESKYIELIIIEKNKNISTKCSVFKEVLEYISKTYKNKLIVTFPENNKLMEYYKKYGFINYKDGYLKYDPSKQKKNIKEYLLDKKSIKSYICESQLTKDKINEVKEFLMNYYHVNTWEDCVNAQTYGDCEKMCTKIIRKFPNYFNKLSLNIYFDFSDIAKNLIHDNKPMDGNHYVLTKGGKIYDFVRGTNCINGVYVLTQKEDSSDKYDIIFTDKEKELINTIVKIKL